MHLQLSPEEFERLLKLAYLGEAVLSDWTPPEEVQDEQRAATDLLYDLCAHAAETPSARLVVEDEASGEWLPSEQLRDEMNTALGNYDNDVFWDELVHRLAQRELTAEYGREQLDTMSDHYRHRAEEPLLDYYWNEVRTHGIDRFRMVEDEAEPRGERRRPGRARGGRSRSGPAQKPADDVAPEAE